MKILVELDINGTTEDKLKYEFMNKLVKDLQIRLFKHLDNVNPLKVQKAILSYEVLWKRKTKAKSLDVMKILTEIIVNIKWYEQSDNRFMIQIDRNKKFEGTNTSLETIAKLIDYGSSVTLPTRYFSNHFNFFAKEARSYWNSYKQFKSKIKVKEIITIC